MNDGRAAADGSDRLATVLRPVRAGNGFEEALEQILQIVRLGLVPEGGRLPAERELAERLGVSRVTLREVLKVLAEQGVVTSKRGRYGGTFVQRSYPARGGRRGTAETGGTGTGGTGAGAGAGGKGAEDLPARSRTGAASTETPEPPESPRKPGRIENAADMEDTLRFREVLEVGAAELCALHGLSKEGAQRLREALEATREAELAEYRRHDTLFHLTLAELAGSPSLTAQYAAVRAKVNGLLNHIPLLVRNLEHAQHQHTELVGAVLDGDSDGAREIVREHCAGTAALLRGFLT